MREYTDNELILRDEFVAKMIREVCSGKNPDLADKLNEVVRNAIDIDELRDGIGWYPELAEWLK